MKWAIILSSAIVFVVVMVLAWGQVVPRQSIAPVTSAPDHEQAQALEALQALRSVTHVGVSYSNYSNRVADTAIIVDRFLDREHPPEQHAIRIAMAAYRLAMDAWGDNIHTEWHHLTETAQRYPALASCLKVDQVTNVHLADWQLAQHAPEPEWKCAEVFVEAAEKGTK